MSDFSESIIDTVGFNNMFEENYVLKKIGQFETGILAQKSLKMILLWG